MNNGLFTWNHDGNLGSGKLNSQDGKWPRLQGQRPCSCETDFKRFPVSAGEFSIY